MRLDAEEQQAIEAALEGVRADAVYLFGSRANDRAKGGDIDILVLSSEDSFELSRKIATRFFEHCEEKIDVVVMNPTEITPEQQAFLNVLRRGNMERLK
ncbi:MAG: nucleotidyltransferase domain-containing protein [Burkholderiales bacterium]